MKMQTKPLKLSKQLMKLLYKNSLSHNFQNFYLHHHLTFIKYSSVSDYIITYYFSYKSIPSLDSYEYDQVFNGAFQKLDTIVYPIKTRLKDPLGLSLLTALLLFYKYLFYSYKTDYNYILYTPNLGIITRSFLDII